MGLLVLAGLGLVVWNYLVPILATMAWNTVSLGIAAIIVGILCMILFSKKFWARVNIILQTLGKILFGWFVEMNEFTILELQLDKSEEDRQELFEQAGKLKAQEYKLKEQLEKHNSIMSVAKKKMELCQDKIRQSAGASEEDREQLNYDLQGCQNEFTNSQDFIDKVAPLANDISRLVKFADKAYKKSFYALQMARNTVQTQRAAWEAVTAGSSAMTRALRAFTGSPEMNEAGAMALASLKKDVAEKMGVIKNCIAETSKLMNERDLNDAAKVSLAVEKVKELDNQVEGKFDYVSQINTKQLGQLPQPVANKWLDTLQK